MRCDGPVEKNRWALLDLASTLKDRPITAITPDKILWANPVGGSQLGT